MNPNQDAHTSTSPKNLKAGNQKENTTEREKANDLKRSNKYKLITQRPREVEKVIRISTSEGKSNQNRIHSCLK